MLLHVVLSERQVQGKSSKPVRVRRHLFKKGIRLHKHLFMISGADRGSCIQPEHRSGKLLPGLYILLFHGDFHLLAVIREFGSLLDHRCLLVRIGKRYRLRLFVQDKPERCLRLLDPVGSKRQIFHHSRSFLIGFHRRNQCILRMDHDPVSVLTPLPVRRINVLCSINSKLRICEGIHLIPEILVKGCQDFTGLLNAEFPLHRLVLHRHFNDRVTGSLVHLVSRVGVHQYLKGIVVQHVPVRSSHFLDPVTPDLQVVRQDQIAIFVGEIGFMGYCGGIGGHLLHVPFMLHIVDLELSLRQKHRFLGLIVLFDDLQLRLEFIIQQDTPLLRFLRMVLRDRHFEIIDRRKVMRRCRFTDDVLSVGNRDGYRVTLLIREHFRLSVRRQDDRFGIFEIIAAVLLCLQGTDQVCGESHTLQQVCIRLAVVGCLDHLERLLDDLLFGSRGLLHRLYQVTFIGAVQVIFLLIQQISLGRDQLLDEVPPEIQIFDKCLAVIIRCQGCHLGTGFI